MPLHSYIQLGFSLDSENVLEMRQMEIAIGKIYENFSKSNVVLASIERT